MKTNNDRSVIHKYAHIKKDEDGDVIFQPLEEHLRNVAHIASEEGHTLGLSNTMYIVGLLHDIGKASSDWQKYLYESVVNEKRVGTEVHHSFAGAAFILKKRLTSAKKDVQIACEMIAYAIISHHTDHDMIEYADNSSGYLFDRVLSAKDQDYEEAFMYAEELGDIDIHITAAAQECLQWREKIKKSVIEDRGEVPKENRSTIYNFAMGSLAQLVRSILMRADIQDTRQFKQVPKQLTAHVDWREIERIFLEKIDNNQSELTAHNVARTKIAQACVTFGSNPSHVSGIYVMQTPTGSGKNFAATRLGAARNAIALGDGEPRKIIMVAPRNQILTQNLKDLKKVLEDSLPMQEVDSTVIHDMDNDEISIYELIADTWDYPMIATSYVQFCDTIMCSSKLGARRFAALKNAVIILDEVHELNEKGKNPIYQRLNFLAYLMGCQIILCSATPPNFKTEYPILFGMERNVITVGESEQAVFNRKKVQIIDRKMDIKELAIYAETILDMNLLIECNTKNGARNLFSLLNDNRDKGYSVQLLHADMCQAHRKQKMDKIKQMIKQGTRVILITTSLAELGLNLSFQKAIACMAGHRNAVQLAGRVDRSGEYGGMGEIQIIYVEEPGMQYLDARVKGRRAFQNLIQYMKAKGESEDWLGHEAIEYGQLLLESEYSVDDRNYPVQTDDTSIMELLASNRQQFAKRMPGIRNHQKYILSQGFRTAADAYRFIENNGVSILVPHGRGSAIIDELASAKPWEYKKIKELMKEAPQYQISLFPDKAEQLMETGGVYTICNGHVYVMNDFLYNSEFGYIGQNLAGMLEVT